MTSTDTSSSVTVTTSSATMQSSYTKAPPSLKDSKNYKDWVKLVKIWSSVTALGIEKQGPAVLLSLEGKSQDAALEISEEILGLDTGLEAIITRLDEIYLKYELSEKYNAIEKFENVHKTIRYYNQRVSY